MQGGVDCFEDPVEITVDVVVPETQHAKSLLRECIVPPPIFGGAIVEIVLPAIDLDDELMPHTHKIDDVLFARGLTPNVKSA